MKPIYLIMGLLLLVALGGCTNTQSLVANDVCAKDQNYTAYICQLKDSSGSDYVVNICMDDCNFPAWCSQRSIGDTTRLNPVGCSQLGSTPPPPNTCIVHGINNCPGTSNADCECYYHSSEQSTCPNSTSNCSSCNNLDQYVATTCSASS